MSAPLGLMGGDVGDASDLDLESAAFMGTPAIPAARPSATASSPAASAGRGKAGGEDRGGGHAGGVANEGQASGEEKKEKKDKAKGDLEAANARAKVAQAAECGVVGIHDSTEVVQSEVGCLKLWRDRTHMLLLHKDCICEMIRHNASTVILTPEASVGAGKEFPECIDVEVPVAIRIPKDDTEAKEKKEKKEKKLKYPKYAFFRGRKSWPIGGGTAVTVEGVHLGWTLRTTGKMPCGCEPAKEDLGLPEPLELLSVEDIRRATGPPPEDEEQDPDARDFLCVSLQQRRTASWKIGHFAVRTIVELVAVYLFMSFLGSEPNTYIAITNKPWDTHSDHTFSMPRLFQQPQTWRGLGMRSIWSAYMGTFLFFFGVRVVIAVLWALLPVHNGCMKILRHLLAALYPMAVSLPLVLYLVYLTAAVVACKQCSVWRCGAYAVTSHHLQLDVAGLEAAGGCSIGGVHELYAFRHCVQPTEKKLTEHEHCSFNGNTVLDMLGISLDTSWRHSTDICEPHVDTEAAKDKVILKEMNGICGHGFTNRLELESFEVTPHDRERMPWTMLARHLPINNNASCPKTGEGWAGPYIYYEPNAGPPVHRVPQGGICACRSAHGARDCFKRTEGTVDRCSHFTAVPQAYGGLLQFDSVPSFSGSLSMVLTVGVPVFALFTIKAWDDIPLAGVDKFDIRMQSRMKLDVLDFFVFFRCAAILGQSEKSLPLVKFIFPDMTWHDFELQVWCLAWSSAFIWWSLAIFFRMVDSDPDKTPKKWKNIQQIFGDAEKTAAALERCSVEDLYSTAMRKQSVLYEKELQKIIKKRTVVDILTDGVDIRSARAWHWRRSIVVFSSPKVKELTPAHFDNGQGAFTLYVAGAWPWSARPPENVWKAESWEEYVAHAGEADRLSGDEPPAGLQTVTLPYDEVLLRVRPGSPYFLLDLRYLGWLYPCGCQPRAEYKKMKEEDHRVAPGDRIHGYSETYYNKFKFDFFERNIEFIGACRSLFVDLLFLVARLARGFWGGGFNSSLSLLLVMKNCIFGLFGITFLLTCGNTRHPCGPFRSSPAELLAKCIERTKIGNAIKLSMLMPLRICIESTSCCFRLSPENRQAFLSQRLHIVALRRSRAPPGSDTTELDHEIRLLAGQIEEYQDLIDMLETKNIVRMRAKIRAKDILG